MAAPRSSEMDELRAVEARLLKEREECERLEAQIRALAIDRRDDTSTSRGRKRGGGADGTDASFGLHTNGSHSSMPSYAAMAQYTSRSGAPPPAPASVSQYVATQAQLSAYAASSKGRSGSPSSVAYRSPLYRSASPSKRVGKDGVVISNFSRSARFREDKGWVPGPGKYNPHDTDFAPVTVAARPDKEGVLGHTWSSYFSRTGVKLTPQEEHEAAMAAATARMPVQQPGVGVGEAGMSATLAAASRVHGVTSGVPRSPDGGGSSVMPYDSEVDVYTGAALTENISTAAAAHIASAGGNVRVALEGALRRERNLRKEVEAFRRQVNAQRISIASTTSSLRADLDAAAKRLERRTAAFDALSGRVERTKDAFIKVDEMVTTLHRCVNDLGSALAAQESSSMDAGRPTAADMMARVMAKHPALARVVDTTKGLSVACQTLGATITSAAVRAEAGNAAPAMAPAPTPMTSAAAGYLSYSSLGAAQTQEQKLGSLGASDSLVREVGEKRAAARGRSESPGQANGASPGSRSRAPPPSELPTRTGAVDIAAKGISPSDVAAFARRASRVGGGEAMEGDTMSMTPPPVAVSGHASSASSTRGRSPSARRSSFAASLAAARGRSPVAPPPPSTTSATRPSTTPGASPTAPILRRMSAGIVTMPAHLTTSPLAAKETTVAETLAQIFTYYSRFGDRESDGSTLKSQQFSKLVRDADMLDARLTPADVDVAYARAVSAHTPGRVGTAGRMTFEHCITALNELAVRKYRGESVTSGAPADPDSFRSLLQEHVLPVYVRLKHDPVFVVDIAAAGASELATAFANEFLRPEVIEFFNEHRNALQGIFSSFSGPEHDMSAATQVDNIPRMTRKGLLQCATEYKIIPDMLSRPELLSLHRDAIRAIGRTDGVEDLTYPEWIELLGMIAQAVAAAKLSTGRSLLTSLGVEDASKMSMLFKINLLFHNMYELGARFTGQDATRMIRAVTRYVNAEAAAANERKRASTAQTNSTQMKKVQDVLLEGLRM